MRQRHAETLAPEEPDAFIAHVRVCGGAGWVTTGSTRKMTAGSVRVCLALSKPSFHSGARLTPVMWTRCIPLPQGELGCRTTRSKNLRQLLSSPACFSTPRTRLAFSRRHHQPDKCLRRCPRLRRTSIVPPCACRCGRGTHSLSPSVHAHRLIITPFSIPQRLMLTPQAGCSARYPTESSPPVPTEFSPTRVH
jgi:hypothetical protein